MIDAKELVIDNKQENKFRVHRSTFVDQEIDDIRKRDTELVDRYINIIPKGRGAYPEEVADAVVFLASDKATFITGQVISVNGGSTMQ